MDDRVRERTLSTPRTRRLGVPLLSPPRSQSASGYWRASRQRRYRGIRANNDWWPPLHGVGSLRAYRLDGRTFDQQWSVSPEQPYELYGFHVLSNGQVYRPERALAGTDVPAGRLSIYDTSDCTRRGGVTFPEMPFRPAIDDNTVYVSTATVTANEIGNEGRFTTLSQEGAIEWEYTQDAGVHAPVVANDTVYLGPFMNQDVPLVAFDASSGDELWQQDVPTV